MPPDGSESTVISHDRWKEGVIIVFIHRFPAIVGSRELGCGTWSQWISCLFQLAFSENEAYKVSV